MGLFRKSDELFEIMSKQGVSGSGPRPTQSPSGPSRPPRPRAKSFGAPFETTHGFGRSAIFGRATTPDLFEVDGEALVVVEDGFDLAAIEGKSKGFAIRADTLIVAGLLVTGLFVAAFLLGRSSGGVETPPTVAQVEAAEEAETKSAAAAQPEGELVQPPVRSEAPAQPPARSAPRQPSQARGRARTLAASAPAPGRWELIVASTTPASAKKLAKWFKTNPLSPVCGRADLYAVASRRGRVSIRGFQKVEGPVLNRVRATNDPLGGSGSFGDAYYKRVRR